MKSKKFWNVHTANGIIFSVPADIHHPTTYRLLEHEGSGIPELDFMSRFIQPGMTLLDANVQEGVHALNMARLLNHRGRILLFNEYEGFAASVQKNGLEDVCIRPEHPQASVDFIHLDDVNLKSLPVIHHDPTLILFTASDRQTESLQALGFSVYQRVPGLNALVPVTDAIQTGQRYFACRLERAKQLHQQGLLIHNTTSAEGSHITRNWQHELGHLPYAHSLVTDWQRTWKTGQTEYPLVQHVNGYLSSRDCTLPIDERYVLLYRSYEGFARLWHEQRSFPAALGLIRCLSELGRSDELLGAIDSLYQALGQGLAVRLDQPLLAPLSRFDNRLLATHNHGAWLSAALMEAQERHHSETTYSAPEQHLSLLTEVCQLPDHSLAMDRRLALCQLRTGNSLELMPDHPLCSDTSLNHSIWRHLAGLSPADTASMKPRYTLRCPVWLPARTSFVEWTHSSRTNIIISLSCDSCGSFTLITVATDSLHTRTVECTYCGHIHSLDADKIIAIIRNDYLSLLDYTEGLVTKSDPVAQDFFVKLITHGFTLEAITPVRFVRLRAERIGHFAPNTEIGLQELIHIDNKKNPILIAFTVTKLCNTFMLEMWGRVMRISGLGHLLFEFCNNNSLFVDMALDLYGANPKNSEGTDRHGLLMRTPPLLAFSRTDHERARVHLAEMGIPKNQPYICFLARDSIYLAQELPGIDWSYHDYRNMSIEDFLPAMNTLADQGIYSLRMGSSVATRLESDRPEIIDYANLFRNEFMDIYLSGTCRMFVSTGTGIDSIPAIFRNMICFVNVLPVFNTLNSWNCLCIHKKLWLNKESRFLSYREQFESGVASFGMSQQYYNADITIVNNSQEEIVSTVIEAWQRVQGEWQQPGEDEYLHHKALDIFEKFGVVHRPATLRLGIEYLKQNAYLLE
jgi:putative glycosyltransferase (TIGR04372 family)